MGDILAFLQRARRLSYVDRCSNTPHIRPYPVAEHSFYLTLYAMTFADIENERDPYGGHPNHFYEEGDLYDLTKVLRKGLLHDLEESETGDILYTAHNRSEEFKKKLDELRTMVVENVVFTELPEGVQKAYIQLWKTAKDETKEGQLIAAMDKFEIVMFAVDELRMGNEAFRGVYNNAVKILERDFPIKSMHEVLKQIWEIHG